MLHELSRSFRCVGVLIGILAVPAVALSDHDASSQALPMEENSGSERSRAAEDESEGNDRKTGSENRVIDQRIRIASFDWSSSGLTATILQKLLSREGFEVQIVAASSLTGAAEFLAEGKLTVGLEYRQTSIGNDPGFLGKWPGVVSIGELGPVSEQVWWYPDYVTELCPGLPDWKALRQCGAVFAIPQSGGRGILLSGPVAWGFQESRRISALGLPFDVVHVSADRTIFDQVAMAVQEKRPILVSLALPSWLPDVYPGGIVSVPAWMTACDMTLSWGENDERTHDCGAPKGPIMKLAWNGMERKWPLAYRIARNLTFETKEFNRMLYELEFEKRSVDEVAEAWIERHEAEIATWID